MGLAKASAWPQGTSASPCQQAPRRTLKGRGSHFTAMQDKKLVFQNSSLKYEGFENHANIYLKQ